MNIDGDTVALVTGANRGLGLAIAQSILRRGARQVVACSRSGLPIPRLVEHGDRVRVVTLDITDQDQITAVYQVAGEVNLLVNNAAAAAFATPLSARRDGVMTEIRTNYIGTFDMVRAFAPLLTANGGAVVNVLSLLALVNEPTMAGYSASKHALRVMTDSLRWELSGRGVAVHAAYPAGIDTDMLAGRVGHKSSPDVVAEGIVAGVIAGRPHIFPDPDSRRLASELRL